MATRKISRSDLARQLGEENISQSPLQQYPELTSCYGKTKTGAIRSLDKYKTTMINSMRGELSDMMTPTVANLFKGVLPMAMVGRYIKLESGGYDATHLSKEHQETCRKSNETLQVYN